LSFEGVCVDVLRVQAQDRYRQVGLGHLRKSNLPGEEAFLFSWVSGLLSYTVRDAGRREPATPPPQAALRRVDGSVEHHCGSLDATLKRRSFALPVAHHRRRRLSNLATLQELLSSIPPVLSSPVPFHIGSSERGVPSRGARPRDRIFYSGRAGAGTWDRLPCAPRRVALHACWCDRTRRDGKPQGAKTRAPRVFLPRRFLLLLCFLNTLRMVRPPPSFPCSSSPFPFPPAPPPPPLLTGGPACAARWLADQEGQRQCLQQRQHVAPALFHAVFLRPHLGPHRRPSSRAHARGAEVHHPRRYAPTPDLPTLNFKALHRMHETPYTRNPKP